MYQYETVVVLQKHLAVARYGADEMIRHREIRKCEFPRAIVKLELREGFSKENYRLARAVDPNKLSVLILHTLSFECIRYFFRISTIQCKVSPYKILQMRYYYVQLYHTFIPRTKSYYRRILAVCLIIIERINGVPRALLNAHVRIHRK